MPSEDWYYDQFDVEQRGGGFDLSDEQTSALDDMSDEDAADYESRFIDELYGTENRQTIIDGENRELSRDDWVRTAYDDGAIANEQTEVIWGLDLRRVDNDSLKVGDPEHYQHLTRGEVDWSAYETDPAFSRAMKDIGQNVSDLSDDDLTVRQRVEWIREANEAMGNQEDSESGRVKPEGEYDADRITSQEDADGNLQLTIDGKRQETLSELYNTTDADGFKKGRLPVGFTYTRKDEDGNNVEVTVGDRGQDVTGNFFDPVAGPPTPVVKPDIKVPNIQVKVPPGLKEWKNLAKETLKVGGKT